MSKKKSENNFAEVKAKINSVLRDRNGLERILKKQYNKMFDIMETIIRNNLEEFAEDLMKEIRKNLLNSSGSGRIYTYVNEKGQVIDSHQASSPGEIPAYFSRKLANAVTYKIDLVNFKFKVGVYSDAHGGKYKTIAFYGRYKRYPKKGEQQIEMEDVVVVDTGSGKGSQVSLDAIARVLENGGTFNGRDIEPRPFLKPAFEVAVENFREKYSKDMKEELEDHFNKKLPIYFRIYSKKTIKEEY